MLRLALRCECVLALLLVALLCVEAPAQNKKNNNNNNVRMITGSLKGVHGTMLMVESANGESLRVVLVPKTPADVTYSGTAELSYLQPGLPIKFSGKFNSKLVGQEPVAEITVFSGNEFGVQEEGAGADSPAEPGKKPVKRAPIDPNAITSLEVQGTVRSVKGNKLMVAAGAKSLMFDLAETASIKVDVAGPMVLKFLQDGDTVDITKAKVEGLNAATAENAKFTGNKPLVGKAVKPLVASKPTLPEKPEGEKKPSGEGQGGLDSLPGEKKPEGAAKPGEAKPGFNANPLFDGK